MASWGPKLYQDDIAQDIRDNFIDLLKRGNTVGEITAQYLEEYGSELNDSDDAPVFWFALADTQWELGVLQSIVKENALKWLIDGSDLKRWRTEDAKGAKVREKVLGDLLHKLNSPMPPEKKLPKYRLYRCEWKIGDVFAYKLESDYAIEKGLSDMYFIIHKVDEYTYWPGHIIPITRVKFCSETQLPQDEQEINLLPYVPLRNRNKDNGMMYLLKLISTSKRIIPKKLGFLGNYQNIMPPKNEDIPEDDINIALYSWKEFERRMIDNYVKYLK